MKKKELGNPLLIASAVKELVPAASVGPAQVVAAVTKSKFFRYLGNGILIALGAGSSFFIGRLIYRKLRHERAADRSDDIKNPEQYAVQLANAMNGLGTDEELVRETILKVPHKQFWERVKEGYKAHTKGRNLNDDLNSELSRQMKMEMDQIISMLPRNEREAGQQDPGTVSEERLDAWAVRVKAAADYEEGWLWPYGTDEEAIYAVLREVPSGAALCRLSEKYKRKYSKSLLQELYDEMSGDDLKKAITIIYQKEDVRGKSIEQVFTCA